MKVCDLTNQRFGKLLVIERKGSDEKGQALWLCHCDCGTKKIIRGHDLKCGTKSCGCSRRYNTGLYQHGLSGTRLHNIWRSMKDRCFNTNNKSYSFYGGRGISICTEWLNDFVPFFEWSNNNGYSDELTLDRIDINGNYCPENCRWIDRTKQANNTRRNVVITIDDETKTLSEWCKYLNLNYSSVQSRLHKGWELKLALTTPIRKSKKNLEI